MKQTFSFRNIYREGLTRNERANENKVIDSIGFVPVSKVLRVFSPPVSRFLPSP